MMVLFRQTIRNLSKALKGLAERTKVGKTIEYGKESIYVSDEVAAFLEEDRKRQEAESRSDRRHQTHLTNALVNSDFEKVLSAQKTVNSNCVLDIVIKNLMLEKLRCTINSLSADEQKLLFLYYYENMSMEEVGNIHGGISKMAISKRLKKLLAKMRSLMET